MKLLIRTVLATFLLATVFSEGAVYAADATAPTVVVGGEAPERRYSQQELDEVFWLAALRGDLNALILLVRQGANPRVKTRHGETALHAAAARGHLRAAHYLVRQGGVSVHSTTSNGWSPLHHAARFGHASVANFLMQSGANARLPTTDAGRKTPIDIAVEKGDLRIARIMGW